MTDIFCKTVIFDLDGVLVDSTASVEHAWQMWAQQHGVQVNDILPVIHGRRSIETMRLVAPHLATDREAEALNLLQAMDTSRDVMVPVFEDAPVGIAAAQAAGMRVIAVATTSPRSALTLTAEAVQTLADVQVKAVMASSKENGHPELVLTLSQPILLSKEKNTQGGRS